MSRDTPNHEMRLVGAFFGDIKGYFVEVGANEPRERSQTWFLEQAGWTGVLVAPSNGSLDCGVGSPIAKRQAYGGACPSGWVASRFLEVVAG